MRKTRVWSIIVVAAFLATSVFYAYLTSTSADYNRYQKIQTGMSEAEVQEILGTGRIIRQEEVPSIVVAVNPKDVDDANEAAKRAGISHPTARNYPIRHAPRIEGDRIMLWENPITGEKIYVAFREGKVCAKLFHDLNYL